MAEQFLNRLAEIERRVISLEEMLKRMVTILTSVNELRSELKVTRDEILGAISSGSGAAGDSSVAEEVAGLVVSELQAVKDQLLTSMADVTSSVAKISAAGEGPATPQVNTDELKRMIRDMFDEYKLELAELVESGLSRTSTAVAEPASAASAQSATTTQPPVSVPPDKSMKIAAELDKIVESLKMGCIAGDVLDTMEQAKTQITKIVPSDQIMVKIDKWAGLLTGYSRRHQVQAKDIMKLKKEIKDEIVRYRPS
ncbi:MAG: hypothetical protein QXS20_03125 [Candidatus Thorarchaeota archaeon]